MTTRNLIDTAGHTKNMNPPVAQKNRPEIVPKSSRKRPENVPKTSRKRPENVPKSSRNRPKIGPLKTPLKTR